MSVSLRDNDLDNIVFTDSNGISYTVKDFRDYTTLNYQTWFKYLLKSGDEDLDYIAQRKDVYGRGAEDQFYKIFEHNIVDLFNVQFDLSKIQSLDIPLP